jgi:carbon monoxide dehydrogenase subunit G
MDVNGSYSFDAPREEVWRAILDPEILSKSLPGIQELVSTGENEFRAKMKVRMGPVQGQFNGIVQLVDLNSPVGYHIKIDASGAQGFVKGEGDLKLAELDGGTELHYSGEAQVGGRIASVGQRLMESSAQALIRQGLEAFNAQIQARMAGEEISVGAGAAEAPSEMEFAFGVTQKMLEDLVPPERRGELIRIGVGLVAFLIVIRSLSDWWTNRLATRIAEIIEEKRVQ